MDLDSVPTRRPLPGLEAPRDDAPPPKGSGRLHRARAAVAAALPGTGAVAGVLLSGPKEGETPETRLVRYRTVG
ncbi:hypothetical protein ABZZ01_34610, partial [Streptomyces virginiae]|uniref:hypothetical protein n=1 Tax=Streptomyces virginiae TaxID=1961 RepID=UPI0033B8092C